MMQVSKHPAFDKEHGNAIIGHLVSENTMIGTAIIAKCLKSKKPSCGRDGSLRLG